MEKDRWGFSIIDDASPLPSQNRRIQRHVVAVGRIDSYVCGARLLRDEFGIAEAAFDDLDAQARNRFDVRGVPHQRSELEVGVGLDEVGEHGA